MTYSNGNVQGAIMMYEDEHLEMMYEDRTYYEPDDGYGYDDWDDLIDDEVPDTEAPFCSLHDEEHVPGGLLCQIKSEEVYGGTD